MLFVILVNLNNITVMDIFQDVDEILFHNDLDELIEGVYPNDGYKVQQRPDNFNMWDDHQFFRRFRLSKATVLKLLQQIERLLLHRTKR